ncbi:hypothetical protein Y032_0185g1034 [Ancylostoma ceylanicum]|uniref:EB domain-containing protein n=2 Tax=Ancylostoma ceylanicum TaxID=53326 RepID=A0A016SS03_9BILA|nr:hypothetical protein Y032_0185g1034 [Ancylostoma ceylanicum]
MKVLLLVLLWTQASGTYGEEAFTCDDTGEECPSKMCFYGIDHERSCYRAGCASEEQCAGRRHNECFISNGLHTCCCMERGCTASYKGRACVDDPKNGTDTGDATTSVTDVSVEESTTSKTTTSSTESHTLPEAKEVSATTLADELTTELETLGTTSGEEEKEETTTVAKRDTTYAAMSTTMDEIPTSTEAMFTSTTTERRTTVPSTSTRTTTTRKETTTSRTTQTTTAGQTTTLYTPRTTRYTTTQVPKDTTTTHVEELRLLPDVAHTQPAQPRTTERKQLITTSMRTTTHATTTPVRTAPPVRKEPVVEQIRELEPAKSERVQFVSPPVMSDEVQKPEEQDAESSEDEATTQANGEKEATSSLISVYEVTTSAVKNREVQQQWKAPVPWWGAVIMGFLVSVIVAWAVVFFLRKIHLQPGCLELQKCSFHQNPKQSDYRKKLREAEAASRKSADKEAAVVDPLLKPSDEN